MDPSCRAGVTAESGTASNSPISQTGTGNVVINNNPNPGASIGGLPLLPVIPQDAVSTALGGVPGIGGGGGGMSGDDQTPTADQVPTTDATTGHPMLKLGLLLVGVYVAYKIFK